MTEVTNVLKPDPEPCVCGCALVGRPRKKVWAGETVGHVAKCPCRRCKGGRQSPKARRREHRIAKDLGGERMALSGALSGVDVTGPVDVEETAQVNLVRGLFRWWNSRQIQRKVGRLMARRLLPRAFVCWDPESRGRRGLVVMEYGDFISLVKQATKEAA